MKKKLLSLILVLMLLPIASIFSACGKNKNVSLVSLDDNFYAIARENKNLELVNKNLVFNYNNLGTKFNNAISNVERYKELNKYNTLFNNIISFSSQHIEVCSNNADFVDNSVKREVLESLTKFEKAINDVNDNTDMFAEIIHISPDDDIVSKACIIRFENLLDVYEELFIQSANLNNCIANLYYNHILNEPNPNVYEIALSDFDPTIVVSKLKSRIAYQKANLTQSYVEMYVAGGGFAHKIATGEETLDLNAYNYLDNVKGLNVEFTEDTAVYKINQSGKTEFYAYSIEAYNLQEILNNNASKFTYACNKINYNDITAESSAEEKMCVDIILENYSLIYDYNSVLVNMLTIIKGS